MPAMVAQPQRKTVERLPHLWFERRTVSGKPWLTLANAHARGRCNPPGAAPACRQGVAPVRGRRRPADRGPASSDQEVGPAKTRAVATLDPVQLVWVEIRMSYRWWGEPTAGEIVWCHFPDSIHPRPKPRPALVLTVFDDDDPEFVVRVVYGTSQRTAELHRGEFAMLRARNPAAYEAAGLSYDTKFNLKQFIDLPYTTQWFSPPPTAPHGQNPKLGTLHPSLVRAAGAALRAVTT